MSKQSRMISELPGIVINPAVTDAIRYDRIW